MRDLYPMSKMISLRSERSWISECEFSGAGRRGHTAGSPAMRCFLRALSRVSAGFACSFPAAVEPQQCIWTTDPRTTFLRRTNLIRKPDSFSRTTGFPYRALFRSSTRNLADNCIDELPCHRALPFSDSISHDWSLSRNKPV